ncbi:MAG: polyphosphate kinase 1 [Planctomycetes bacterium]|nr:polyphosphate kinase 1 [Planctomycetota bacterium]
MAKDKTFGPECFFNRELSWLEFNHRVLEEGLSENLPLLERLKFLAIVSSNLDEFFMIRVAGLMQQRSAGLRRRGIAGMTAAQQLSSISQRTHRLVADQTEGIHRALAQLRKHNILILDPAEWTPEQRRFLQTHFAEEIQPVLTPLAMQELDPKPLLPGLELNVALSLVADGAEQQNESIVVVSAPRQLRRLITVPAESGLRFARLEDVITTFAAAMFPGCRIRASAVFRLTRDADVDIQDDDAGDLLHAVEEALVSRRRRAAVRLEISDQPDTWLLKWLMQWLKLRNEDVYEIAGMLDATALWEIVNREGFDDLRSPEWPPQPPQDLIGEDDLFAALQDRDVLFFHPYESFDPVVQFVERSAADPGVLAIKLTLYRTSGDSPIIKALERAAENGKQVVALVELKARFDEARNVQWARRLEDAGCHVIYGIAGFKTHSKALLVVRRESGRIRRYAHLATGNYNDKTARLYSDIGLMTADRDVTADVAAYFNLLTGYSETVGWSKLTIAPTGLRRRFVELIEREIQSSTPERPGLIMAKVNSLQDHEIIRALYRASRAGVRVQLNVRGICCLRPGLKGVSETIEVTSIVDRFLEHARIFYFSNGGHDEVYLSSADWMGRNLDRRLEILFPIIDPRLRRRLVDDLRIFLGDNVKARRLLPDGSYERVVNEDEPLRAQERLYTDAVAATQAAQRSAVRFRPMKRPEQ